VIFARSPRRRSSKSSRTAPYRSGAADDVVIGKPARVRSIFRFHVEGNIFGFSGSPVTYLEEAEGSTPKTEYVIGVISGFRVNHGLVRLSEETKRENITKDDIAHGLIVDGAEIGEPGHIYRLAESSAAGKKTPEMVLLNTGIVEAYTLTPAVRLIKEHPIGPRAD
jgi:hypothetical protein